MLTVPLIAAALTAQLAGADLVPTAIATAKSSTSTQIVLPYLFEGGSIIIETPFLRVALQARDAMDRYLPFSEADVDRSRLDPVATISARDKDRSFKHLVIAIPPPGPQPTPPPQPPPPPQPTYEEILKREKERRKAGYSLPDPREVAAQAAQRVWRDEMDRFEREARAAMVILQPTRIEATEHVWQNAYSATFKTTG